MSSSQDRTEKTMAKLTAMYWDQNDTIQDLKVTISHLEGRISQLEDTVRRLEIRVL